MNNNLPVLLLKSLVLLPCQDVKLEVNNDLSKKIIFLATKNHKGHVLVVCPKDQYEENPDVSDLPLVGVVGKIKSNIELPNGNHRVIISGIRRVKVKFYANYILDNEVLEANTIDIEIPKFDLVEETAIKRKLNELVDKYVKINPSISNSFLNNLKRCEDLDKFSDTIIAQMPFSIEKKIHYMEEINALHRAKSLIVDINIELQINELDQVIDEKLQADFENNQRQFLLKEKLKEIQRELGTDNAKEEIVKYYTKKLNSLDIPLKTKDKFFNEIKKFEYMVDASPEISAIRNYLDLVLNLPWNISSVDENDLKKIRKCLDKSHYGLEKVKDRIIEYIAVKERNKDIKTPIICLVGPPGVGKTSLAKWIAKSLKREFLKISVGGLNDSSELNGHRRTYLGSSPGKIIEGIKKCGVNNPLILIDEVDKMVNDYKGDPSSVLLDILDEEQNSMFIDSYVEEPFDLSKVMFILTANDMSLIPSALLDRLEIIELSSYTEFEKLDIALDYILPSIYEEYLISNKEIRIGRDVVEYIIKRYTKEAGVRELRRQLEMIVRKVITESVKDNKKIGITIKKNVISKYLGVEKFIDDNKINYDDYGIVNGLAYTPFGGIVMPIESALYEGEGEVIVTGMLGQVMNESVEVALSYIKKNKDLFKVNDYYFDKRDIHLHFLDGSVKKDGPSAGVGIVSAILSLILKKKIDWTISMTGEVSLNGDVLRVGGLKEKLIGAYNGGIKTVFIPKSNKPDLDNIPKDVLDNLKIVLVDNYLEIYKVLFGDIE